MSDNKGKIVAFSLIDDGAMVHACIFVQCVIIEYNELAMNSCFEIFNGIYFLLFKYYLLAFDCN